MSYKFHNIRIITDPSTSASRWVPFHKQMIENRNKFISEYDITVTITASAGKGKSVIAAFIADALAKAGFADITIDDDGAIEVGCNVEVYKKHMALTLDGCSRGHRIFDNKIGLLTEQKRRSRS